MIENIFQKSVPSNDVKSGVLLHTVICVALWKKLTVDLKAYTVVSKTTVK